MENIQWIELKFPDGVVVTPAMKRWIAKAIGNAVIADQTIQPEEREHLKAMIAAFGVEPEMLDIFRDILTNQKILTLEPIEMPPKLAEWVFRYILEICASDHELHPDEINYLHKISTTLQFNTSKKVRLIQDVFHHAKWRFFQKLMDQLHEKERYWLAAMILKVIYADGRIDRNEIAYFSHISDLLSDSSDLIASVKQDAANFSLEQLGPVQFTSEITASILRYLIEITMSDGHFDDLELELVREVARMLDYNLASLQQLIEKTQSQYKLLLKDV